MRTYFFFLLSGLVFLPLFAYAQGNEFMPLTSLPGLKEVATQDTLAPFLSQVYKICIGLAAVLAVLQIMFAGVQYMGGDSITEKKDARQRITLAIVGLVLVLSPVIVFSVINPDILKLDIKTCALKEGGCSGTGSSPTPAPSPAAQTNSTTNTACSAFSSFSFVTSSELCSALGSSWKDAPASCCSLESGQQCCGK
jgi:hypothetical protein